MIKFFPSSFKLNGDWYLYINILLHSNIEFIPMPLNYYRKHLETVRSSDRKWGDDLYEKIRIVDFLIQNFNPLLKNKVRLLKDVYTQQHVARFILDEETNRSINSILKHHEPYNYILELYVKSLFVYSSARMLLGKLKQRLIA